MNPETVNLIERPYQEIVDDILTAMVGGVVNEPIIFDVKNDLYPLAEPARDIHGITGTAEDKHHTFQKEIDFLFNDEKNVIIWQEGGTWPDDDTVFHVDYFRKKSRSPLTDINVGSVSRTLGEAIGREIATVYQQINEAYMSAFVDTAKGKSLDLVVAILGIKRLTKDYARGQATFFRDPAIKGNITIPENTRLTTTKGEATFRTSQMRTLQRGQVRINVPILAGEECKGDKGKVAAGAITQIALPIAGIAKVTNFDATFLGAEDESDEELRTRAKAVMRAMGKATLAALARVIFEERATLSEVWDPNSPANKQSLPGTVTLLVESEPELFPGLRGAVEETRAAGIQASLVARYIYFTPRTTIQISSGITAAGKIKIMEDCIAAIQAYVDSLSSGDAAEGQKLLDTLKDTDDVNDAKIVDVMAWQADIGQPGAETLVDLIMTAIQGAPADDPEAQREVITKAVTEMPPLLPTSRRIPDRSLVQGPDGQPATDEQIEAGEFKVVASVDDQKWWVVLDIETTDIYLQEKED